MARTLLVADKSIVIQKSVGITFAQEDFKVAYANDGEEALSRMRQMKPDCLLVHTSIPKRDGYAVCEAIKNDPQLQQTPVLLLVGTHEAYDEAKGQAVKADGYVIKPFESQALIERVNTLLAGGGTPVATPEATAAPAQPAAPAPTDLPPSQVETSVSTPPAPEAAPQMAQPSPASTIAGQMPISTPAPVPQEAPEAKRDAPMLDMEEAKPEPVEDVFDFSFDEAPEADAAVTATPAPLEPEAPVVEPEPAPAAPEAANEGEFWDFSEETAVESPPEPAAPVMDAPSPEQPATPAIEMSESAPEDQAEPEVDFGFDVSPEDAEQPTASFEEPVDVAPAEIVADPEPLPEDGVEISMGDMSGADETPVAPAIEMEAPPQVETVPLMDPSIPSEPATPAVTSTTSVDLSPAQVEEIVTKVFRQVIERIAWEVVPDLAETIIKEELERLTKNAS